VLNCNPVTLIHDKQLRSKQGKKKYNYIVQNMEKQTASDERECTAR